MVPERQFLPPPPMETVQESAPNRGLRTDDGIQRGLGFFTLHGQVWGSTVALNLQTERLRPIGHD